MATDDEVHQLQRKYDVSPALAQLLCLLARNQRVTAERMQDEGIVADARVSIHRLRKIMSPHGIEIRSSYRTGYWLSDEDRQKLLTCISVAA